MLEANKLKGHPARQQFTADWVTLLACFRISLDIFQLNDFHS
jgi:hypothetical protein